MILGSRCASKRTLGTPEIATAVQRLKDDFAFVGLTERFADSVCIFHALFGGRPAAAEFVNVRPRKGAVSPPFPGLAYGAYDETPLIGWQDIADEALYAEALRLFGESERHALQRGGGGGGRSPGALNFIL
eukprot:CAMPEP_0172653500 /NCGR_PEP_ID=MMETSP1068-20121228/243862_1 /TAXON_ID=35684 /ORGANISM="Pseudopedinella elastica, Strain CCMP716" /LENGTH=130 /DNA_ID=CAMNT_0013467935 /DNA_START=1155 /DNA_END=1547 /DNA_ORIENTATION=+